MKKSNFEFIKEYYPLLVSITILLVISVFHLVKDDLLIDESSSLLTSELSLNKVLHRALFWEEQAPLYYLVLAIWRLVSAHYIFARLLSLIFMLGSFLFMFRIFKKYESSQVLTTLMLILVAVNFNIVYAAVNIRYYSFTILLSVFLLYIFLNHYLNQQPARLSIRILFSIIAIVAISSQYFIGFLLLALGFTVFVKLGFKRFLHYCLDMLPAIFVVFVLLTSILHQMGTYEFLQGDDRSIFTLAKYLFFRFSSYVISFHFLFEINWFKYGMSAIFFSLIVYCFRFYK
ncbi:MAG: hypothetical protein HN921_11900, partial [Bacteroidetes bacterium]|nr:hypothetical protein [Bacteroidota bacterium]